MPIISAWWPEVLARLFKRAKRASAGTVLPLSVERALAGLTAVCRPDHEDKARVLLHWATDGCTIAWHHTPAETRRRIAEAFPGLDGGQLDLACRSVSGMVRTAQHAAPTGPTKCKWSAKRWKARGFDNADF